MAVHVAPEGASPVYSYSSVPRRRFRQLSRLASGTVMATRSHQRPLIVRAFWWDGHRNFGDALTPWLLGRYGLVPFLRPPEQAELVGVGSILEMVPNHSDVTIWGSGLMHQTPRQMPRAKVLAVRGPLTRDLLGLSGTVPLGDPGLLVSRHLPRPRTVGVVAVVPHGHHTVWPSAFDQLARRDGVRRVRFDQGVSRAVRQIASADLVVSSSLHGLIVADAYGIPAVWAVPVDTDRHVPDMKFADHHAALGIRRERFALTAETTIKQLQTAAVAATHDRVSEAGDALERSLLNWSSKQLDMKS